MGRYREDEAVLDGGSARRVRGSPTTRFRKILAVCDDSVGSDDVLVRAIAVARASGARLTVAKSLVDHPGSMAALEEKTKHLSRIVPWIVREGVDNVSTEVLVGPPDLEVCQYALRFRYDLVIASENIGRRRMAFLRGNPAASLMRRCPCAVWIVKDAPSSEGPVLAAVDATTDGPTDPLDMAILNTAATFANARDAGLHVVHSWDVAKDESDRLKSLTAESHCHAILDKHRTKHGEALEKLLLPLRSSHPRVKHHLPRGDPATEIARLASEIDASLVVMGTTCRVGVLGLVMGSAAGTVLSAAPCGVLAVKSNHIRTSDSILKIDTQAKLMNGAEN